jgi:hypothetical protein
MRREVHGLSAPADATVNGRGQGLGTVVAEDTGFSRLSLSPSTMTLFVQSGERRGKRGDRSRCVR